MNHYHFDKLLQIDSNDYNLLKKSKHQHLVGYDSKYVMIQIKCY